MLAMGRIIDNLIRPTGLVDVLTYLTVIPQSRWKYPSVSSNAVVTFNITIYCTSSNRIQCCYRTGFLSDAS